MAGSIYLSYIGNVQAVRLRLLIFPLATHQSRFGAVLYLPEQHEALALDQGVVRYRGGERRSPEHAVFGGSHCTAISS